MIIIIGGGVFGLAIGWQLARAGRSVTILEQGRAGRGATWAAAGMLMPWKLSKSFSQPLFDLQRASHGQWPAFARQVERCSDVDIQYHTDGRYFLAVMDKAANRLRRQYEYHRQLGFPLAWLSGDELRRREPSLGPKVLAGIFASMAHRVDNRRLVVALKQAFERAGGALRENSPALGLEVQQGQVRGVQLPDGFCPAKCVIVAAGAWSGQVAGLPESLGTVVKPRKGQTLILQMAPRRPLIERPMLGPVYLVPRDKGQLVVGTTVEREAGFDTQPTVAGVFHILRKAQQMVPGIKNLPVIEMAAGLRPTAPGRLPVLGPTEIKGLAVATGGHSYGILLSPIVAQTIGYWVLTGKTSPLIKPFVPAN